MIQPILKIPDLVLRKKAAPVAKIDRAIGELVRDMQETMYAEPGCGLAAPQIGVSLRVIVYDSPESEEGFQVLINPEIMQEHGLQKGEEGCLSVPGIRAEVARALEIRVEGLRLDGQKVSLELKDFTARILQHEIDHINGILFIDRLSMVERAVIEKKLRKIRRSGTEPQA